MAKTADGDRVKVDYYWDFVEKSSAFISSLKLTRQEIWHSPSQKTLG